MKRIFSAVICTLVLTAALSAVPPAPGVSDKGMPKDSVHKIPNIIDLKAMGYSPDQVKKALSNAVGTKKLAVVFVNFSDLSFGAGDIATYVSNTTISTGTKISTDTGYLKQLANFITETSSSKMTLEVYPFTNGGAGYTITGTESYYGSNNEQGVVDGTLFKNAVLAVGGTTVTTSLYDALMVVHAGVGEESGGVDANLWSVFVDWPSSNGTANGFKEGETVPAQELASLSPFGVLCHEFGHQLGLPDLYQTVSPNASRVGKWDLMDYGAWINNGANPPHFSSWCKALINWITPTVQASSADITLNAMSGASANCYKVPILGSATEYFLFEYRRKTGFDSWLPGEGVLIWHIDDSKATVSALTSNTINNGTPLAVALEEKDKDSDVSTNPRGEATDPFNATADIFTTPYSDSYTNGQSFVTLFNFAGVGTGTMTAKLFSIPASSTLSVSKALNYPNPVKSSASTTIKAVFSRPFTTATLRVFTLSGEPLFERALTQDDLNTTASTAASEWIYEYNWDLKNSDGTAVASGIYIYSINAVVNTQNITKTGKLAIIR